MLRINIIAVGKNKDRWVDDAVSHYLKLLKKHASVSMNYIRDTRKAKNVGESDVKKCEAESILKISKADYKIALDVKGKMFDSERFAKHISKLQMSSGGTVDFIIGGVYGLDDSVVNGCRESISLSPLTMSHQLIRAVLLEQLYRGFSIISGGKYHR
jgi:23S rRNA (pseudouridine1915-N3)-methyltransferase